MTEEREGERERKRERKKERKRDRSQSLIYNAGASIL